MPNYTSPVSTGLFLFITFYPYRKQNKNNFDWVQIIKSLKKIANLHQTL